MLEAGQKLVAAGFDLWAIIIMGLTGQDGDWEEHILSTARMINEMRPRHLSAMTFAPAKGTPLGEDVLAGRFQVCTPDQILEECRLLIEHLDVDPLHFTSNHASNYLPLKGGLPEEREKFLSLLDEALAGKIRLRKTLNQGSQLCASRAASTSRAPSSSSAAAARVRGSDRAAEVDWSGVSTPEAARLAAA